MNYNVNAYTQNLNWYSINTSNGFDNKPWFWCKKHNSLGGWCRIYQPEIEKLTWYFENEADAVLFALIFK